MKTRYERDLQLKHNHRWLINEDPVRKGFAVEAVVAARENAKRAPDQSKSSSRSPFYNHGVIIVADCGNMHALIDRGNKKGMQNPHLMASATLTLSAKPPMM